jgi:hybrid polyketide synthase/nonribosomal peptide synthetase ACE1
MFSEHKWALASPNAELAMGGARATVSDYEAAFAIERVCIYFMKKVVTLFPEHVRKDLNLEWHFYCLFEFFENVIETVRAGTKQSSYPKWLEDTEADIAELKAK